MKKEVNKNETNTEDGKPGTEENDAIISTDTSANADNVDLTPTDQVLETVNKNVNSGESPDPGENNLEVKSTVNGVKESEHSEC